jgi:hypothetical protein
MYAARLTISVIPRNHPHQGETSVATNRPWARARKCECGKRLPHYDETSVPEPIHPQVLVNVPVIVTVPPLTTRSPQNRHRDETVFPDQRSLPETKPS